MLGILAVAALVLVPYSALATRTWTVSIGGDTAPGPSLLPPGAESAREPADVIIDYETSHPVICRPAAMFWGQPVAPGGVPLLLPPQPLGDADPRMTMSGQSNPCLLQNLLRLTAATAVIGATCAAVRSATRSSGQRRTAVVALVLVTIAVVIGSVPFTTTVNAEVDGRRSLEDPDPTAASRRELTARCDGILGNDYRFEMLVHLEDELCGDAQGVPRTAMLVATGLVATAGAVFGLHRRAPRRTDGEPHSEEETV